MSKDYADQRAAILRNLDGLSYEVDVKKKVGFLWLDRPPLNVVSYRGRSQIAAILEAFGHDPDVRVVVIRGRNGVYTSGGDVKAFPQIERDGMSHLAWNIAAPERCPKPVVCVLEKYAMGVGLELAMACDSDEGCSPGTPGGNTRPNSRQRRQSARGADCRVDAGSGHDDARPSHFRTGST